MKNTLRYFGEGGHLFRFSWAMLLFGDNQYSYIVKGMLLIALLSRFHS